MYQNRDADGTIIIIILTKHTHICMHIYMPIVFLNNLNAPLVVPHKQNVTTLFYRQCLLPYIGTDRSRTLWIWGPHFPKLFTRDGSRQLFHVWYQYNTTSCMWHHYRYQYDTFFFFCTMFFSMTNIEPISILSIWLSHP